ncbi:hypothetical protein D3C85_1306130 [compost metagenome]
MKVVTCQASGSRHRLPGRVAGSMVSLRMRSAWGSHSSSTSSGEIVGGEGHGRCRGHAGAYADRQHIHAGHHCGLAREMALDQAGQQHIAHGDAGTGQYRRGKQPGQAAGGAQQGAKADEQQGQEQHALGAKAA